MSAEAGDAVHHARQDGPEGQRRGARLRRQQPHRPRHGPQRGAVDRAGARGARPRRQLPRHRQRLRDRGRRRQGHQGPPARQRRHLHQEPRHVRPPPCSPTSTTRCASSTPTTSTSSTCTGWARRAYDKAMAEIVPALLREKEKGKLRHLAVSRDRPARPRAHHAGARRGGAVLGGVHAGLQHDASERAASACCRARARRASARCACSRCATSSPSPTC